MLKSSKLIDLKDKGRSASKKVFQTGGRLVKLALGIHLVGATVGLINGN